MQRSGRLLLVLGLSVPVALGLTVVTWPFWGWFEEVTGIESLGHSGPADWCFAVVYLICAGAGWFFAVRTRRKPGPRSGQ